MTRYAVFALAVSLLSAETLGSGAQEAVAGTPEIFAEGFESGITAAWTDTERPIYLEIVRPNLDATLNDATPEIEVRYWSVTGAGVDPATLTFRTTSGDPIAVDCLIESSGATCAPRQAFAEGGVKLLAQVADLEGELSPTASANFTVDLTPPAITVTTPADNFLTSAPAVLVAGHLDQAAELTLNFQPLALGPGQTFLHQVGLTEGSNLLTLRAVDVAGNLAARTLTVTRDNTPPPPLRTGLIEVGVDEGTVTITGLAGAAEGLATVRIRNLRTGEVVETQAAADGSFSVEMAGALGDELEAEVEDGVGLRSAATRFPAPYAVLPDPATFAPPLDPTVAYNLADALKFLHTGTNPTQSGVAPGTLERKRVAWLRGRALERGGQPLAGVKVSVAAPPGIRSHLHPGRRVF